jgi:hypothetical protein
VRHQSGISLADALSAATKLGGPAGHLLTLGAQRAFIGGIRLAVTGGAVLSAAAALFVLRWLPSQAAHGADLESAIDATDPTAELGLAGTEPAFAEGRDRI